MSTAEVEPAIPEWTLGWRLLRARQYAGLEQQQVADELGVSRALVSMWERDLSEPRNSQLKRLARVTGVNYAWLDGNPMMYKYHSRDFGVVAWSSGVPEQLPLPLDARDAALSVVQ